MPSSIRSRRVAPLLLLSIVGVASSALARGVEWERRLPPDPGPTRATGRASAVFEPGAGWAVAWPQRPRPELERQLQLGTADTLEREQLRDRLRAAPRTRTIRVTERGALRWEGGTGSAVTRLLASPEGGAVALGRRVVQRPSRSVEATLSATGTRRPWQVTLSSDARFVEGEDAAVVGDALVVAGAFRGSLRLPGGPRWSTPGRGHFAAAFALEDGALRWARELPGSFGAVRIAADGAGRLLLAGREEGGRAGVRLWRLDEAGELLGSVGWETLEGATPVRLRGFREGWALQVRGPAGEPDRLLGVGPDATLRWERVLEEGAELVVGPPGAVVQLLEPRLASGPQGAWLEGVRLLGVDAGGRERISERLRRRWRAGSVAAHVSAGRLALTGIGRSGPELVSFGRVRVPVD
ncbi:MAG TPA: hypothetical protein RMH85_01205 [Polyangiaceae bacterium LLY-WYZ-15_(1-7)]|nr:hypothetical protein [Sandaracinus sp.]HJL00439.1 hypothetical protein [Polyangiaceae bacterium LLY-WYZ-15_(1-7)]HJL07080.1 hypothetical protein [Polyangiaceae bacterium LLY-WYZ-15_(1-7)]HJL36652.1 hypothetical protein [Polyangiaceae bacterium LLY-WYZ-15_(1-7)]